MTKQRDLKKLVRARMAKTGESYQRALGEVLKSAPSKCKKCNGKGYTVKTVAHFTESKNVGLEVGPRAKCSCLCATPGCTSPRAVGTDLCSVCDVQSVEDQRILAEAARLGKEKT